MLAAAVEPVQQQQQQQQQLQEEQWQQWSANQPPPPLSLLQRSLDISNMQQQQQQQPQLHLNHLLENNGGWTLAEMDKHTVGTNITSAPAEFDAAWNHNHSHQQHQQPLNLQQLQHTAAPPPPGLIHDRPDAADAGEEDKWMIDAFIKTQQDLKASTRHIPPFFTPPPLQLNQFKRMLLDSDGRNPSVNTQLLDQAVQMRQDQTDWAAQFKQQLQLFNDEDVTQQQQHAPTTTNDTPDQPIHIDAASEQDALAKTAATLAHIMNNVDGSSSTSSSPSLLLSNSNNISNSSSAVSSTNATEAKFKQSKFLQFMKELGSGAVIVKDGKVVPNDSATGTTAYINNNPVTCNEQPIQAFEAAKQFLGDSSSSTASWEEDFNLDSHQHDLPQRRGAEWVHEFASAGMSDATATTTNHHTLHPQQQQPASSTNAGDWATQFQLQQQEYIDPLHDPSEIEWEVDISNSSGDEHEYPFLPSNPYSGLIRTPRQALDRLASCTSIAESILVLEAGAITSDHTRSQVKTGKLDTERQSSSHSLFFFHPLT